MNYSRLIVFLIATTLVSAVLPQPMAEKGLKDYYKNYFPIGVAVAPRSLTGPEADFIRQQFASITPENAMKMGPIHPEENRYYWQDADAIVDFAQKNGLKVRGHTLCWHNQTPRWLFTDASSGKQVSKDVLLARMKQHINDVMGRYKGKIYAWDVVNEAVPDTSTSLYRKSKFYEIIGEEYIEKAFQFAHEADPNAVLFYNDYNTESAAKREKIYQLLKKLKAKGVPVQGVGLQGHWSIYEPTAQELEESINKFASLGLKVQITELDMSVYPKEHERREKKDTDKSEFTPEMDAKQAAHYKMLFDIFRKHKNQVTGVTFWNISDKSSWLDNFPVPGRKDYPLLFDANLKPKKAYWEIIKF
jgi:endo-1,4-beta-xylanase